MDTFLSDLLSTKRGNVILCTMLLLFRVWNGLWLVRTSFNPDEYWQGPEIGHRMSFGYGWETWEWKAKIRGYSHPALYAIGYELARRFGGDDSYVTLVAPRLVQAAIATAGDVGSYAFARRLFPGDRRKAMYAVLCGIINWFMLYAVTRTYSSSVEAGMTVLALAYWYDDRDDPSRRRRSRRKALCLVATAVVVRPTAVMFWITPILLRFAAHAMSRDGRRVRAYLIDVLVVATGAVVASCTIDRVFYGTWTFVPWNFVRFNVLEGGSAAYGSQPWHFYVTQALPAVVGTMLPLLVLGTYRYGNRSARTREPILASIGLILSLSFISHKEMRFLLPVMYVFMTFIGAYLSDILHDSNDDDPDAVRRKKRTRRRRRRSAGCCCGCSPHVPVLGTLLATNGLAALYLCQVHQRAPLDVMAYFRGRSEEDVRSILFLTSCHATPYYSHLHRDLPMRFLDCSPPAYRDVVTSQRPRTAFWLHASPSSSDNWSEVEMFSHDPSTYASFLLGRDDANQLPSHIVTESFRADPIYDDVLRDLAYVPSQKFFHSHIAGDRDAEAHTADLIVYERPV